MDKTFKTRLTKDGAKVETAAHLDFDGVTADELQELASATVIINQQAIYRTSGVIPKTDTIKVREQLDRPRGGGGFKATPENILKRSETMTREDYIKLVVGLGANEQQANKMADKREAAAKE